MRYFNIVELDVPDSYLIKISASVDWRTTHTYTLPLDAEITLASTDRAALNSCLPIIRYHRVDLLRGSHQTWQVILHGELVNGLKQ